MKKKLLCIALAFVFTVGLGLTAQAENLALPAPSCILMEKDTGQILYEENAHEKLRPASVTKIMTLLLVMDAVGLGVFTVVGVQCAYRQAEHDTLFLTVFVGLITGVGGGVLRDVFSGERPYIFVRHFYACASIIGALICALCWDRLGANAAMLFGAAAIVVLRLLAAYYHWSLPKSDYHDEPQTTTAAQTNQDSEIPQ